MIFLHFKKDCLFSEKLPANFFPDKFLKKSTSFRAFAQILKKNLFRIKLLCTESVPLPYLDRINGIENLL